MRKTYIVTESGGDLFRQDAEKYEIEIVPMHVQMEGESRDDGAFPVTDIFDSYKRTKVLPKTSATNPHEYKEAFDRIMAKNPDAQIIHVAYSAITTASYHNAVLAAEGMNNVTHIDTKNVTGGQRAVVLKIAEYIENNPDATPQQIKEYGENMAEKCQFAFFPGDLEYLKAGGRVSNAAYLVASMLNLKPLIEMIDGKLVGTKKYRGNNDKVFVKFLDEYLANNSFEKETFFMVYSAGLEDSVKKQLEHTARKHGYKKSTWVPTGCVIATHAGPGAFGAGGFKIK